MNKARIIKHTPLTENVFELSVETLEDFSYKPGQYISIKIMDDPANPCFRAYSIASAPTSGKNFDLCIRVMEDGRGSNWLNTLKDSDEIEFLGPIGEFTFTPSDKDVLFVATGTGIAPFKAIIADELAKGNTQKMHLIFGVRHIKWIFYEEFFRELESTHDNFTFDITLSRPENLSWQGHKGRVTEILPSMKLDPTNTEAYICGLTPMIDDVSNILRKKGLPEAALHFEKYD